MVEAQQRWRCSCAYDGTDVPVGKSNQAVTLCRILLMAA